MIGLDPNMRILHVISSVNPTGGGPIEGVKQFASESVKDGHLIEVASLDAPDDAWVKSCPLSVHALGPAKGAYAFSPRLVPWLRSHVGQYDVVIVNGLWQFNGLGTCLALSKSSTPYFVFSHGMLDPWFKQAYPLKHLKKSLYWIWGEYQVLSRAAGVCFTCEEERRLARESFRPYRVNEIVVSYGTAGPPAHSNPVEQQNTFLEMFPQLTNRRFLLFLSRIHVKKGCDLLIEAFARVAADDPELLLVMAGPDQTGWRRDLEALAAGLGIADRLVWTGMLSGDAKWGAFHLAEVFVLPSHQENFGIAVAEALASGLPVLISNKVNIWNEITEDGAGLVAPDTLEGTMRLLKEWQALSTTQRETMGKQARDCFTQRFEIRNASRQRIATLKQHIDTISSREKAL